MNASSPCDSIRRTCIDVLHNFINHLIVYIEGVVSVVHDGIINIKLVDVLLTGMCRSVNGRILS